MVYCSCFGLQNDQSVNPAEVERNKPLIEKPVWELLLTLAAAVLNFGAKLLDYLRDRRNKRRKQ